MKTTYPKIFESLVSKGIEPSHAEKMIEHAISDKKQSGLWCFDTTYISSFCCWSEQGVYSRDWTEAGKSEIVG